MIEVFVLLGIGAAVGYLIGVPIGVERQRRRIRRAIRNSPRDQIAYATLERLTNPRTTPGWPVLLHPSEQDRRAE